jgi:hypothetical protein
LPLLPLLEVIGLCWLDCVLDGGGNLFLALDLTQLEIVYIFVYKIPAPTILNFAQFFDQAARFAQFRKIDYPLDTYTTSNRTAQDSTAQDSITQDSINWGFYIQSYPTHHLEFAHLFR